MGPASIHYSITPLLHHSTPLAALTNQSPMRDKGPVNQESAPDEIFLRHRSPITAVIAIVAVIAHCEITMWWHDVGHLRRRKEPGCDVTDGERNVGRSLRITMIGFLCLHHPANTKAVSQFAIYIELG